MRLLAATAKVDITVQGYRPHDTLYGKILMLQYADTVNLIISMDCICLGGGIGRIGDDEFFPKLKGILSEHQIDNVICGTTHTHTHTPMVVDAEEIIERIVGKLDDLRENLEPVTVGMTWAHENSFIINRTLRLKDGSDWSLRLAHPCPPEESYDSLVHADDTAGIIRIDKEDKSPLCVLFNFGCHPLVGYADNQPTANYPGIAERFIEEHTGAMAMMLQTTGGDVMEIDYKDYFRPKDCTKAGLALGQTVVRAMREIETNESSLSSFTVRKAFPIRKDLPEAIEKVKKQQLELCEKLADSPYNFKNFLPIYMKYMICPEYPLDHKYVYLKEEELRVTQLKDQDNLNRHYIQRYLENIETMERLTKLSAELGTMQWHQNRIEELGKEAMEEDVTGIRLGDILILSAPFEPLTKVGACIKELSDVAIFFASYSNGYMHYGATEDKYHKGGYETCECFLDKTWLSVYLDAVREIIKGLGF